MQNDETQSKAKPSLKGHRVLLVEDSADNQILIKKILTREGAEVDLASDGAEGVDKALQGDHAVILMDVQMPILDGNSATRKLRDLGYGKPIIALTAHAMREEKQKSIDAGCNDYLTKPIDTKLLVEKVARYAEESASNVGAGV